MKPLASTTTNNHQHNHHCTRDLARQHSNKQSSTQSRKLWRARNSLGISPQTRCARNGDNNRLKDTDFPIGKLDHTKIILSPSHLQQQPNRKQLRKRRARYPNNTKITLTQRLVYNCFPILSIKTFVRSDVFSLRFGLYLARVCMGHSVATISLKCFAFTLVKENRKNDTRHRWQRVSTDPK